MIGKLIMALMLMPMMTLANLTDGLVAYYPFDGNANDASGNGYDLINGGAVVCADRYQNNGAMYFNGSVKCSSVSNILFSVGSGTISFWVRSDETISLNSETTSGTYYTVPSVFLLQMETFFTVRIPKRMQVLEFQLDRMG